MWHYLYKCVDNQIKYIGDTIIDTGMYSDVYSQLFILKPQKSYTTPCHIVLRHREENYYKIITLHLDSRNVVVVKPRTYIIYSTLEEALMDASTRD